MKNEIVGYATFMKQFSTWDAQYYMYLCCLYLKEKNRGNGIGKEIMNWVKTYAKDQNCSRMQWQTPSFNTEAIKFYKNLGAIAYNKERFLWSL
ncbi:GNAT family N-acetyltransferase [Aquimarina sp. RZ0]|uniref:GNAT family N-acetyltransferase n=1 Tax=Aquimarina sp. RZ0 TaxID=2607730 RepID=UPI0021036B77|nr:GNAT family N-acetyltransferase [Aquimarina sp. RZ0]